MGDLLVEGIPVLREYFNGGMNLKGAVEEKLCQLYASIEAEEGFDHPLLAEITKMIERVQNFFWDNLSKELKTITFSDVRKRV